MNPPVPQVSRRLALFLSFLLIPVVCAGVLTDRAAAGPALPDKSINALFELKHPKGLQEFAKSVSTPGNAKYQQYRSVQWIVKQYGAKKKTKKKATRWLESRGIDARPDATGQAILATMTKDQADHFLAGGASISSASKGGPGRVPAGLDDVVSAVGFLDSDPDRFKPAAAAAETPGGFSPTIGSARKRTGTPAGCAAGQAVAPNTGLAPFTPNQYLDAYGHSTLHKQGFKGQGMRMAVVEIDGFLRSDIETFGECFGVRVPPTPVTLVGIKKPLAPGGETTLDLEVLSAAAPQLKKIFVYQGLGSEVGLMASMGSALGNAKSKPDAISMSIGGCEALLTGQLQFRRGIDNILAVAAGAGIPFFISAGDVGAAGCPVGDNSTGMPFPAVQDPSSSKFATGVGGTNFSLNAQNKITEEVVWNDGTEIGPNGGGGGLSILSNRPWYQRSKQFNQYGPSRAVPDITGLADLYPGYSIYCSVGCPSSVQPEGGWSAVGGTSAATPLMAAGVTLLNQKRKKAGHRSLGFLNPLIYRIGNSKAYGQAIRDVTIGNNDTGKAIPPSAGGTGTALGCCTAKKGYDVASGWGSLKLAGFGKVAAKYNPKVKSGGKR